MAGTGYVMAIKTPEMSVRIYPPIPNHSPQLLIILTVGGYMPAIALVAAHHPQALILFVLPLPLPAPIPFRELTS